MSKQAKKRIIIISICLLIIAAIVVFYIHYINNIGGRPHDTLIYNGMKYNLENGNIAYISSKAGLKFVGLTRWTPIGIWCPVYAEDIEIPSFLVYGFVSRGNSQKVYWLEGTHQLLDTDFARFDLSYDEVIFTTTDTFILRSQVAAQPEYVTTNGGLEFSDTGLEILGYVRAYYERPEDFYVEIGIFEKEDSYYLEGYRNTIGEPRKEYYLIKPDSELMEFVEMIKSYREVS